jgi:integrase
MALYKRNGIYHCDFVVNCQRFRQTLETRDWREAIKRENDLKARAREGTLASGRLASLARLYVDQAFDLYLPQHEAEIHVKRMARGMEDPKLEASYAKSEQSHAKPVRAFFSGKRLRQVTAENIQAYQTHRIGEGKAAKTVNHEVKLLLQLLKKAKLLGRIGDEVELLPLNSEPRRMLTPAQKQRVFETAALKPEWQTAYCAALLTVNTSVRPAELRRLLWSDLDPVNRLLTVRKSKSDAGSRIIPLNDEAWSAIVALKTRADASGSYAPEYYVFHRQWPKIDPARPMSNWRSAWRSLRKAAGMPKLRYYDLRHQCITEMLEAGIPEGVIREVAGHVDPEMTRHYSHPRIDARRAAVEALMIVRPARFEGGYVTNHVTKALPAETLPAQHPLEAVSVSPAT